ELDYLSQLLKDKRQLEPIARVSVLKLMMLLADEHHRFWRGVTEVELLPETKHALDQIESTIRRAEPFEASSMPRGGFEKLAIEKAFEEFAGMTMPDYARRRRVFYAACHLLFSEEEPRRISKALGFVSMSEFNREFESIFDIPPSVYREKFGPVRDAVAGEEEA
ncbi:MAG: helix-turn-helix domain-containing protein, partial [Verrucomicrobiota bacterium]